MVLMVLPLLATSLMLSAIVATFSSRNSITAVATRFLQFKAEGIVDYANGQVSLLEENGLADNMAYLDAAKSAIGSFALNAIRNDTELIFALTPTGSVDMSTRAMEMNDIEMRQLAALADDGKQGWRTINLAEIQLVAHVAEIESLGWFLFVTEERDTFYRATNQIAYQIGTIMLVSLGISMVLLLTFALYLTRPIRGMLEAMNSIIETRDLGKRVKVLYNDEIGKLGHTFNIMVSELDKAYDHIKEYALRAAVAKMREQKIRNIFQKYVPKDVIDQFFANPEAMLVGENRILSVLFSDIRGFTSISERLAPDEMVESLNQYFTLMVDAIISNGGIVDKYMGDAIMAFFGAPVHHTDDALRSAVAGLEMVETLKDFNYWQRQKGRPEFRIGVGINYGAVTVGNIGSEKKMDYTVIGDMVNLASRLEGLTKIYLEPVIVSESVKQRISEELSCRLLDRVAVKGRSIAAGVYGVRKSLTSRETEAWDLHHKGMAAYYQRDFVKGQEIFSQIQGFLPDDQPANIMVQRCEIYRDTPPPKQWNGAVEMMEK